METHVSSTTADVRDTQEVIGSDGNVELVITVEKIEEDLQQKADSDSQDNAQPVVEEVNPDSSQTTRNEEGLLKSPRKQDLLRESMGKEVSRNKTAQPSNKVQSSKQSTKSESKIPPNKSPEKQQAALQNSSVKELPAQVEIESTSSKDIQIEEGDEVDDKDEITLDIPLERPVSNDPQTETSGDISEKEHNKSISRELKSLINSAKESKIISECTKVTTKTRKSRAALDTSNTNTTSAPDGDREQSKRRSSSASQKSNASEKSDKVAKRSMRSQNPEFVHKVKRFLNSVTGKFQRGDSDASSASDEEVVVTKNKQNTADGAANSARKRKPSIELAKGDDKSNKLRSDPYCWRCHWSIDEVTDEQNPPPPVKCTVCPRTFHSRCLTGNERAKIVSEKTWVCPECIIVLQAESADSRSSAMKRTPLGMLCDLLNYALQRMKESSGAEHFLEPVDRSAFPDYDKYVVHPMDLTLMKENIAEGLYGSTEAFLADTHWILHNSIIFNTLQSKLTAAARALVRACRAEMSEIEACPECYLAAHARRPTWFTDVCTTPHMVLWAKLKGFPYWPAKAMSVTHAEMVDVRFFGAHDRAWVPARDCYLYCEKDPNNFRTKRPDILDSMQEAEQHIRNISRKYGKFLYAPYRTVFEPSKMAQQLKLMIPSYDGPVRSPIRRPKTPALGKKSRSNSKSSKDDSNIGDILSDTEPMDAETSKASEDAEGATPVAKSHTILTRKRKRSETKDPAGNVPDSSPKAKRRLVDNDGKESAQKNTDAPSAGTSNDTAQKQTEASEELIVVDCEPASPKPPPRPAPKPDTPATRATSSKPDAGTKTSKNTPKTNVSGALPNRTPTKTDTVKVNEKGKGVPQEEKTLPQNMRNSRSNKSLTNIETIEVDDADTDITPINKMSKQPASNTPKPSVSGNKTSSKEAAAPTADDEEKVPESAVLIKITDKERDSTQSFTINVNKNKSFDTATLTKIAKILNPDKNKEAKVNDNNDNAKEKTTMFTSPAKTAGKTNSVTDTPTNKNLVKQKSNDSAIVTNKSTTNEKPLEVPTTSNNHGQEKEINIASKNQTLGADETADNNTDGKRNSTDKDKTTPGRGALTPKPSTSKIVKVTKVQLNDDTSSPVIARKVSKVSVNSDASSAATTSGVQSAAAGTASVAPAPPLTPAPSLPTASPPATKSPIIAKTKTTQITVEVEPDSNIFTPTCTDNVRNMKEAVNKLQKLKSGLDPPVPPTPPNPQVGRVGVRSFARMTSPEKPTNSNEVLVEIKSEPMDLEETEVQDEATVLNALRPRPIAPAVTGLNLREVRISKVMPAPVAVKKAVKVPDIRPRAKKTFPQPKKPDDGRAELTSKNSMVYIPIQGPVSQAQVRAIVASTTMPAKTPALFTTTNVKGLTPMGPPLMPMAPPPPPPLLPPPPPLPPLTTTSSTVTVASGATVAVSAGTALAGAIIAGPGFPTVPTTVHTVPLITSVNGQWTFSLQPVMSVGGGEQSTTSPTVNGLGEKTVSTAAVAVTPTLVPVSPAPALAPLPPPPPATTTPTSTPATVAPEASDTTPNPAIPESITTPTATPGLAPAPPALVPTSASTATAPNDTTPDLTIGEPPALQQRPVLQHPLAPSTEIGDLPAPSAAGPLTARLNQNSIKLAEFFRTLLEDSLTQVEEPSAEVAALRLQLEQARWHYQHEVTELRHTHELLMMEVRSALEKEKTRAVAEARRLAHQELEAAVKEAKSKQWCSNCGQEAQFYCCWNTSYCDYPCQRAHWSKHFSTCTQQRTTGTGSEAGGADGAPASPLLPLPPPAVVSKSNAAPSLAAATKVTTAASRVSSEQAQTKSPVVVSAVEDGSTPGTKSATAPQLTASLPPNKKLISKEDSGTKRMVTSGGYLIVGANSGAAVVAPPEQRRAPPRQD